MRFDRLRGHQIGPFADFDLDLDAIDGKLVAVIGENGAGKSTLLELLTGSLYRKLPTRGSLASLATARDTWVEATVTNGQRLTVRQSVDSISGKGESLVQDANGRPVVESGKLRHTDEWIARHLPSPEVVYASTFAPQGSSGFLGLSPGDRKAVLLRALGIERLELLANAARERARDARVAFEVTEARLAELGDVSVEDAESELAVARDRAEAANDEVRIATGLVETARAEVQRIAELRRAARGLQEQRDAIGARRRELLERLRDLERRAENNRGLLAKGDDIRAARARAAELRQLINEAEMECARETQRATLARQEATKLEREIAKSVEAEKRAAMLLTQADQRLADRTRIEGAVAVLEERRARVVSWEADLREHERLLEDLRGQRLAGAEERIAGLRGGLGSIADPLAKQSGRVRAAATLAADDQLVGQAEQAPAAIANMQGRVAERKSALWLAREELAGAESAAALAPALEQAAHDRLVAEGDLHDLGNALRRDRSRLDELRGDIRTHDDEAAMARTRAGGLRRELEQLGDVEAKAKHLDEASGKLAVYEPQIAQGRSDLDALDAELAAVPAPAPIPDVPTAGDVAALEASARATEERARRSHAAIALADRAVEQARATSARRVELTGERDHAGRALADWTRLAADLGRDGLQALEIDAAGPELTASVNDLLHTCVGSRFSIAIETTRTSADGKRAIEGLEVSVLDTEKGRAGPGETFSGGERVIIGEAISLALSMIATRRAGLVGPTLVRDESGAALDPANARAYLAMLRRAAELVGASRVLLVTHDASIAEACDARIVVANGTVEVQS